MYILIVKFGMNGFKLILHIFYLWLITILPVSYLYSQFTGYGNDQRFQASMLLTKLEKVPPYESEMPPSCSNSYMIIENLTKTNSCDYLIDKLRFSPIDTIKFYTGFLYEVLDYSPYLFRRYNATINSLEFNKVYKSNPNCLFNGFLSLLYDNFRNIIGEDYIMILSSHYIFEIQIDSVVIGTDTSSREPLRWINVSAKVLKTYKGQKTPSNCKLEGSNLYSEMLVNDGDCLNFGYIADWETGTGLSNNLLPKGKIKSVSKGERYLAFLRLIPDGNNVDIISPENRFEINGGLFKIQDDFVYDTGNFFKLGSKVPIKYFESELMNKIKVIKSWYIQYSYVQDLLDEFNNILIYPQPFSSDFTILNPNPMSNKLDIEVYSLIGNLIQSYQVQSYNRQLVKADFRDFPNGTYILRLRADDKIYTKIITKLD